MARTPTHRQRADIIIFEGTKPHGVVGLDALRSKQLDQFWDDDGIASTNVAEDVGALQQQLVDAITQAVAAFRAQQIVEVETYGAAQAMDAVIEYLTDSRMDVALYNGQVIMALDASSDAGELRPWWYERDIKAAAIAAARANGTLGELVAAFEDDWDHLMQLVGREAEPVVTTTQVAAPPPEEPARSRRPDRRPVSRRRRVSAS